MIRKYCGCLIAAALGALLLVPAPASAQTGALSILLQDTGTGRLLNWQMNGTNRTSYGYLTDPGGTGWQVVGTADFNNDGKPDILFQNAQSGQLVYWIMDGTSLVRWGYINPSIPGPIEWKVVATVDLTSDGQPDILFQNQNTGELVYWVMSGTTLVRYGYLPNPGPDWKAVATGLFSGNNSRDILLQNQQSGQLI
jgi:hypothetical protein